MLRVKISDNLQVRRLACALRNFATLKISLNDCLGWSVCTSLNNDATVSNIIAHVHNGNIANMGHARIDDVFLIFQREQSKRQRRNTRARVKHAVVAVWIGIIYYKKFIHWLARLVGACCFCQQNTSPQCLPMSPQKIQVNQFYKKARCIQKSWWSMQLLRAPIHEAKTMVHFSYLQILKKIFAKFIYVFLSILS